MPKTPRNRIPPILALLALAKLALASAVQGACPSGSGAPIILTNMGAKETVSHEYLLIQGKMGLAATSVTITREAAGGFPAESYDWPADSGIFKGFARLRPGNNPIMVSAAGHASACMEAEYKPNPLPGDRSVGAIIILPKDQGDGPGLITGTEGEASDLESLRKRLSFGMSLASSVSAELLGRAGLKGKSLTLKLDAQGRPEVQVFRSKSTSAELTALGFTEAGYSLWQELIASLPAGSGPYLVYPVHPLFKDLEWRAPPGSWFASSERMRAWPQAFEELGARLTDNRPGFNRSGLNERARDTRTMDFSTTFGEFLDNILYAIDPARSYISDPTYAGQLFTLRERHIQVQGNVIVKTTEVHVTPEKVNLPASEAQPLLATGFIQGPLNLIPARSVDGLVPGLGFEYFEGTYRALPDFRSGKVSEGASQDFALPATARAEMYAVRYTGYIRVPKDGAYRFSLTSDDGSRLYIDDSLAVDNDGAHAPLTRAGAFGLSAGLHAFRLEYFNGAGGDTLALAWESQGMAAGPVPASVLLRKPPASGLHRNAAGVAPVLRLSGGALHVRASRPQAATIRLIAPSGRRQATLFDGRLPAGELRLPAAHLRPAAGALLVLDAEDGSRAFAFPRGAK